MRDRKVPGWLAWLALALVCGLWWPAWRELRRANDADEASRQKVGQTLRMFETMPLP